MRLPALNHSHVATPRMLWLIVGFCVLPQVAAIAQRKGPNVAVLFSPSGKGDRSYNDMVLAGIDSARKVVRDLRVREVQPSTGEELRSITSVLRTDPTLVVAVGFTYQDAITRVAASYPHTSFLILDAVVDAPNVRSAVFRAEEGSFLAGVAAAYFSKAGKTGYVVGMDIPIMQQFECGFRRGVAVGGQLFRKPVSPVARRVVSAADGFGRPDLGRDRTRELFNDGVDVVFHAAGRSGLGVIREAHERRRTVIGVDYDQRAQLGFKEIRTSMMKRLDLVVLSAIHDLANNTFVGGRMSYGIAKSNETIDGVQLARPVDFPPRLASVIDSMTRVIRTGTFPVCE